MYLAGNAETTINGGSVTGDITGIEIRAGKLVLNNCDVTGGYGDVTAVANGNGATVSNAALAVSQHTTKKPINVTVNGGSFPVELLFMKLIRRTTVLPIQLKLRLMLPVAHLKVSLQRMKIIRL